MMKALVLLWLCVAQGQAAYMVSLRTSTRTALNSISMGLIKKQERNEDQGSGGLLIDKMKAGTAPGFILPQIFPPEASDGAAGCLQLAFLIPMTRARARGSLSKSAASCSVMAPANWSASVIVTARS